MVTGKQRGKGSGAIMSTAGDLVIWNEAVVSGRLGALVAAKMQEPAKLNNGRKLIYTRGLNVHYYPGATLLMHSGGANGYSAWQGVFPDHKLSVAVLCNADEMNTGTLAYRVADLYLPPPTGKDPGPVAVPGVDVTGRAGLFFSERTGEPLRLIVNRGRLFTDPELLLVPVSADKFRPQRANLHFRSQDDFEITFRSNDEFELRSMEGQVTRFRRPAPYVPAANELQSFAGRYESEEIGSIFRIVPGKNNLVMRLEVSPSLAVELNPVERDTFEFAGRMIVRFRRDASGKVVAFDFRHPSARHNRFNRLGVGEESPPVAATKDQSPAAPSPPPPPPPSAPATRLEAFVGEYEMAPGRSIVITLEDGRLHGQPSSGGAAKLPMTHVSGTTFSAAGGRITLTFTVGADGGRAAAFVMRRNGAEQTLTRIR